MLNKKQTFELLKYYGEMYIYYLNAKYQKSAWNKEYEKDFFARADTAYNILKYHLQCGQRVTILKNAIDNKIDKVTDSKSKLDILENLNITKLINELNIIDGR